MLGESHPQLLTKHLTTRKTTQKRTGDKGMTEEKKPSGIVHECLKCRARVTSEELARIPETKCPNCGFRVLRKVRPPIVKRLKAR